MKINILLALRTAVNRGLVLSDNIDNGGRQLKKIIISYALWARNYRSSRQAR